MNGGARIESICSVFIVANVFLGKRVKFAALPASRKPKLMMKKRLRLNDDDVVSLDNVQYSITKTLTFKIREAELALYNLLAGFMHYDFAKLWLGNGMSCKLLKSDGGGWIKGKIRLRLEFIPDEPLPEKTTPPSPLDDLRAELNLDNQ